jgi:hypothetical protein
MEEHDLPDWPEALSAVTEPELKELRRFVSQVERLARCSFFQPRDETLKMSGEQGKPEMEMQHTTAPEEALLAVVTIFRQIHTGHWRGSAGRAISILKQSAYARDSDDGRKLIALLKYHQKRHREIAKADGGFQLTHQTPDETKILRFGDIIDILFNGDYLHWDEGKAAIIEVWPPGILQFQLTGALMDFRNSYWVLANCVKRCLQEPALTAGAVGSAAR